MSQQLSTSFQIGTDFSIDDYNFLTRNAFQMNNDLSIEQEFNSYYFYKANISFVFDAQGNSQRYGASQIKCHLEYTK